MGDVEGYEINFEPIKPKAGLVSVLVRDLRDERLIAYLDSSSIVKRYIEEPGSRIVIVLIISTIFLSYMVEPM
jgi:hypothetical protein